MCIDETLFSKGIVFSKCMLAVWRGDHVDRLAQRVYQRAISSRKGSTMLQMCQNYVCSPKQNLQAGLVSGYLLGQNVCKTMQWSPTHNHKQAAARNPALIANPVSGLLDLRIDLFGDPLILCFIVVFSDTLLRACIGGGGGSSRYHIRCFVMT